MFFSASSFAVDDIEVFKLSRNPYRKTAQERPFHAISYRIYGNAAYELNGETINTKKDDILFVPANLMYTKETQAEKFYVVHFYSDAFLGDKLLRISPSDPEKFRLLFDRLYKVQLKKGLAYEHECKQLFYQLVTNIEREWAMKLNSKMDHQIDRAIKNMHECFSQPEFSVAILAKRLNMSETYFRREFRKVTGKSPKQYVSELRLQLASELLRSGYFTVSEVAQRCGFSSAYYFSSFMKQATGKSPRDLILEAKAGLNSQSIDQKTEKWNNSF